MPDTSVRYLITADPEPAVKAAEKVNNAFSGIGTAAQSSMAGVQRAFDTGIAAVAAYAVSVRKEFGGATSTIAAHARQLVELGGASAAARESYSLLVSAAARGADAFTNHGKALDTLTNSYRAARLIISPTLFTATTVAAGIAAEEILRYTYNRGKQIEADTLFAAKADISIRQTQNLAAASLLAGKNYEFFGSKLADLSASLGKSAGQNALEQLGIFRGGKEAPDLLIQIATAFERIKDPSEKARLSMALFEKTYAEVLPELNRALGENVRSAEKWGAVLGPERSANIGQFKSNVDEMIRSLGLIGSKFSVIGSSISNFFEDKVASAANRAVDSLKGAYERTKTFIFGEPPPDVAREAESRKVLRQGVRATELRDVARNAIELDRQSRSGIEDQLADARSRQATAAKALESPDLSSEETIRQANRFNDARHQAGVLGAKIAALDLADQRASDAADAARAVSRSQNEAVRSSAESLLTAQSKDFGPLGQAFLEAQRESLRDSSRVDKDGNLQRFPLTPETARNIQQTLAANLLEIQKKQLAEQQKGIEEAFHLSVEYDSQLLQKRLQNDDLLLNRQIENGVRLKEFDVDQAGFDRDSQLRALDTIDAQTLAQKKNLESRKADIEVAYQKQVLQTRLELADDAAERELADEQRRLENLGLSRQEIGTRLAPLIDQQNQSRNTLGLTSQAAIAAARDNANNRIDQITREGNLNEFNSIKSSATSLIDTLFTRTRDFGKAVGDFFRHAVLAPLEEIAASQVAKLIFGAINPGQSVSFASGGGGTAKFGRFGGILGSLGLGTQPVFSSPGSSVIAAPPPAGDVSFGTGAAGISLPGFPAANLAASLPGLLALNFGGYTSGGEDIGAGRNTSGLPTLPSGLIDRTGTPQNGPVSLGVSPLAGAAGLSYGTPRTGGVSGSLVGAVKGGIGSNIASFFGFGANSVYGSGIYGSGITGALGTLATSPAAAAVGSALLLNGIQRRPGAVSTIESAGGGALTGAFLGAKSGDPVSGALIGGGGGLLLGGVRSRGIAGALESTAGGALAGAGIGTLLLPGLGTLAGAAIGAAAGLGASLIGDLIPTDRQSVKDQVKSLYRLTINNSIADQIISVAKSSFGGSFSVAIRSKQILDLLSLYAQSTGQNFLFKNSPTPAYITEQGGILGQQYTNIGGKPYSFGGSIGVQDGIQTSIIPTYVAGSQTIRTNGQTYAGLPSFGAPSGVISLDANATTALLQGQAAQYVAGNPTDVASSVAAAQQSSFDRRTSAARLLSPGLLVG